MDHPRGRLRQLQNLASSAVWGKLPKRTKMGALPQRATTDEVLWSRARRPRRVRPPPLQTGRANFPHPASRVKPLACASPIRHDRSPSSYRIPFRIDPDGLSLWNARLSASSCATARGAPFEGLRSHPFLRIRSFQTFHFLTQGPFAPSALPDFLTTTTPSDFCFRFPYTQTSQVPVAELSPYAPRLYPAMSELALPFVACSVLTS